MEVSDFTEKLLKVIGNEREAFAEKIARGVPVEEYRENVGRIKGLDKTIEIIKATLKTMYGEEDEES